MKNNSNDEIRVELDEQIDTLVSIDIEEACLIKRLDDLPLKELDDKKVFTEGVKNLFREEK